MKKNLVLVLALLGALLGLSACNDLSSPESTLASAATAASKNNLKDLQGTLAGDALATYGNAAGMALIQKQLAGFDVKTANKKYMGLRRLNYRHEVYTYSLDVMVRAKGTKDYSKLWATIVACDWHRGHPGHYHGGRGGIDMPDTDIPDSTECKITELK